MSKRKKQRAKKQKKNEGSGRSWLQALRGRPQTDRQTTLTQADRLIASGRAREAVALLEPLRERHRRLTYVRGLRLLWPFSGWHELLPLDQPCASLSLTTPAHQNRSDSLHRGS